MPIPAPRDPLESRDLTQMIEAGRLGDRDARDEVFGLVYEELRRIAGRTPFVGQDGATLQPTALVNEAYLMFSERFPAPPRDQPENRSTFFLTVALAMRTILRDHWRKQQAQKRGGGKVIVALGEHDPGAADAADEVDFLALDDALTGLEAYNRRWADVVMHRYFAGRSIEETAELMGVGVTAVKKDWRLAKAWLLREMTGGDTQTG